MGNFSVDQRKTILKMYDSGMMTADELCAACDISRASLFRWLRRRRETGTVQPLPRSGRPKIRDVAHDFIRDLVSAEPYLSLTEMMERFNAAHPSTPLGRSSINRVVCDLKLTYKKKRIVARKPIS